MGLDVLLQVLRTLEGLSAEVAFVWLKRDVDSDVGSDMVALDSGGTAGVPTTGKVQVVGALPADMFLADVLLEWKLAVLILSQVEGENEVTRTKSASADVHLSLHLSHWQDRLSSAVIAGRGTSAVAAAAGSWCVCS